MLLFSSAWSIVTARSSASAGLSLFPANRRAWGTCSSNLVGAHGLFLISTAGMRLRYWSSITRRFFDSSPPRRRLSGQKRCHNFSEGGGLLDIEMWAATEPRESTHQL